MEEYRFAQVLLSGSEAVTDSDGLIWKDGIRTGCWAVTPGPNAQPIEKPLVVKLDSDDPNEVSLRTLVRSFRDRALDHVTVPLTHADRVDENTGFVEDMLIVPDEKRPGEHVLKVGYRFTEPEIKDKVTRGTIANNSLGILFNYIRKRDGRKFPQVVVHSALTNKPWIDGLKPFGVNASEMACFSDALYFTSPGESGPLPGGKPGKHDNWVDEVGGLPRYIRRVARDLMEKGMPKSRAIAVAISRIKVWAATSKNPKVKAKAIAAIAEWEAKKARAHAKSAKSVATSELPPRSAMAELTLDEARQVRMEFGLRPRPPHTRGGRWLQKARQDLIQEAYDAGTVPKEHPRDKRVPKEKYPWTYSNTMNNRRDGAKGETGLTVAQRLSAQNAATNIVQEAYSKGAYLHPGQKVRVWLNGDNVGYAWHGKKAPAKPGVDITLDLWHNDIGGASYSQMAIAEMIWEDIEKALQKSRREVNMSDETTTPETVETTETEEVDEREEVVFASEDSSAALAEAMQRIRELEAREHQRNVEDKLALFSETYRDHPAFLARVREFMLADDGGAVLALSEDGSQRGYTTTEVIESLIELMPKPTIGLSDQVSRIPGDDRRPADRGDDSRTPEERAAAAAAWMGDRVYQKSLKK